MGTAGSPSSIRDVESTVHHRRLARQDGAPLRQLRPRVGRRCPGNGHHLRVAFDRPFALYTHPDPVGPATDNALVAAATAAADSGGLVFAGWGVRGALHGRGAEVRKLLAGAGGDLHTQRLTKHGNPGYPLRGRWRARGRFAGGALLSLLAVTACPVRSIVSWQYRTGAAVIDQDEAVALTINGDDMSDSWDDPPRRYEVAADEPDFYGASSRPQTQVRDVSSSALEVSAAPLVWLWGGLFAAAAGIAIPLVTASHNLALVGWLVGGTVSILLMAFFTRRDLARRGEGLARDSALAPWLRRLLLCAAAVAVVLNAWTIADALARDSW
ncbi:DUF1643 domain-containing protein [Nocardioides silvaticus]|uniref:DUF1643 domain-containing protein n=1 Tax=Nocardioides silvaticus TaxID=2201891 RepID=UPI00130500B2